MRSAWLSHRSLDRLFFSGLSRRAERKRPLMAIPARFCAGVGIGAWLALSASLSAQTPTTPDIGSSPIPAASPATGAVSPTGTPPPEPTAVPTAPKGNAAIVHGLVDVNTISPRPLLEVRYATPYNFTGRPLYPFPAVYVHRDVAAALQRVQAELAAEGLGLKIYDGYRPFSVQELMWKAVPDERYVSNPAKSKGKHTRGTAVDVTLVDRMGNELPMPTPYDDFTDLAHRLNSPSWRPDQRKNSLKLEALMKKHGFIPFAFEWWHYDYKDWESHPPLDVSFEELAAGKDEGTDSSSLINYNGTWSNSIH